jgi:hypothetical protein
MRGAETITVHPHTGQDWEGVDTYGTTYTVAGCIPWPRTSAELEEGGTVIGEHVWVPPVAGANSTIKDKDNVTLRGIRYAVDGKPGDLRKAGRAKGLLVILKGIQ